MTEEVQSTANPVKYVYNFELAGLIARLDDFAREMAHSQSSGAPVFYPEDLSRLRTYIATARRYRDHITSLPLLDLPKTHPQSTFPVPNINHRILNDTLTNRSVEHVIRLFELTRDSLAHSDSSRMSSAMIQHDIDRLTATVDRLEKFVDDYVVNTQPIDMPETGPAGLMPNPGVTGIEGARPAGAS